jgi:hypothetical protein
MPLVFGSAYCCEQPFVLIETPGKELGHILLRDAQIATGIKPNNTRLLHQKYSQVCP